MQKAAKPTAESAALKQLSDEIEGLVLKIDAIANPALRADVLALVQSIMDLHAAGLRRLLDFVGEAGEPGRMILAAMAADDLTGSLLLLHSLHPNDLQERVAAAIDKLGGTLRPHGSTVELVEVGDGIVRVRLESTGASGCGNTAASLQQVVEDAIYCAAPDATVVVENLAVPQVPLVQLQIDGMAATRA